jgi:DNA-directed RNA polymerase specialized sigma24 family protein
MAKPLDTTRLGDHLDKLYRAAWALSGSREDAEDLVQETYARVLKRPRLIRYGDDLGYLLRALRNTFLTQKRTESAACVPLLCRTISTSLPTRMQANRRRRSRRARCMPQSPSCRKVSATCSSPSTSRDCRTRRRRTRSDCAKERS